MDQLPTQTPGTASADSLPKQRYTLRFERFSAFVEEYASLLSLGGMFLKTESLCEVGSNVGIDVKLTDGYRLFQGSGEVVWVRPQTLAPGQESGMAVRFQALDESGRELILKILEEQVKGGGQPFDVDEVPADLISQGAPRAEASPAPPTAGAGVGSRSTWPSAMGGDGELSEEATLVTQRQQLGLAASQGLDFSAPWGESLAEGVPADLLHSAPSLDSHPGEEPSSAAPSPPASTMGEHPAAQGGDVSGLESPFSMETTDFDDFDDLPELEAEDDLVLDSDAEVHFDRTMAGSAPGSQSAVADGIDLDPPAAIQPAAGAAAGELGLDHETPTAAGSLTSQRAETLLAGQGASTLLSASTASSALMESSALTETSASVENSASTASSALAGHEVSFEDPTQPRGEAPATASDVGGVGETGVDVVPQAEGLATAPWKLTLDPPSDEAVTQAHPVASSDEVVTQPHPVASFDAAAMDDPFATHEPTAWPTEAGAPVDRGHDSPLDSTEHLEAPTPPAEAPVWAADADFAAPVSTEAVLPASADATESPAHSAAFGLEDYELEAPPAAGWRGAIGKHRILLASLLLVALVAVVFTLRHPIAGWLGLGGDAVSRSMAELENQPPSQMPSPSEAEGSGNGMSADEMADGEMSADRRSEVGRAGAAIPGGAASGGGTSDAMADGSRAGTPTGASTEPGEVGLQSASSRRSSAAFDPATAASQVLSITARPAQGGTQVVVEMDGSIDPSGVQFDALGYNPLRQQIRLLGIELPFRQGTVRVASDEMVQIRTGLHAAAGGSELRLVFDMAREGASAEDYRVLGNRLEITVR